VQDGETITNIAKRYGITVRDVVKWNNLTTMTITTGMKLKVSAQ
jgi:LysM repeat protein